MHYTIISNNDINNHCHHYVYNNDKNSHNDNINSITNNIGDDNNNASDN